MVPSSQTFSTARISAATVSIRSTMPSGTTRRMRSAGGQFVSYELYRDSPRNQRWGNTLATDTLAGTGSGNAQSLTVYGRVAPQAPTVGTYNDTITVTVTY